MARDDEAVAIAVDQGGAPFLESAPAFVPVGRDSSDRMAPVQRPNRMAMHPPLSFYEPLGDGRFLATSATVGPWGAGLQHGGPPSALMATLLDGPPDMPITRLVVDFLGPMPAEEIQVDTYVVRPGKRVELVEARMSIGGRLAARAAAWRMRVRPGLLSPSQASLPPARPSEQVQSFFPGLPVEGYAAALEWRFVSGSYLALGPAEVWARPLLPILPGEPITGLQRVLLLVDSANGVSAEIPHDRWIFVPSSLHVALLRRPTGEWVFLRARTILSDGGVGVTEGSIFDDDGELGTCTQSLFVAPKP